MDTNQTLYQLFEDYKVLNGRLVLRLMPSRVKDFLKQNQPTYMQLLKRMEKLSRNYFVFEPYDNPDPAGMMERIKTTVDTGIKDIKGNAIEGSPLPVMLPEKLLTDYEKDFAELMAENVIIH